MVSEAAKLKTSDLLDILYRWLNLVDHSCYELEIQHRISHDLFSSFKFSLYAKCHKQEKEI